MKQRKRLRKMRQRLSLLSHRRGLHKWQVVVITWGPLLWACVLFYLECKFEPADVDEAVMNMVLESARPPPLSKRITFWSELYPDTERRRGMQEQSEAKPRTFPRNYDRLSFQAGRTEPLLSRRSTTAALKELRHLSEHPPNCQPKSAWHSYSFPTCNSVHELDFVAGVTPFSAANAGQQKEISIEYKFSGGTRESWLVHTLCTDGSDCVAPGLNATATKSTGPKVVLKTLNWPVEHDEVVYEHQRIDALASERLTSSPHVVDIYGFCGVSALNEFADGGNFGRMLRHDDSKPSPEQLLVYARDAALSLAAIHEVDGRGNVTTLVHHDFSAKNFLTVNGKLKVSDFNDAKLLGWHKGKRCRGFSWDGLCGTNRERTHRRAPEECMGDEYRRLTNEKVEVYHLGAFFFYLLSNGGWPYQFEPWRKGGHYKLQAPQAKEAILQGRKPSLPPDVDENNPSTKILVQAMRWTHTFDPKERPSARAVADFLVEKIKDIDENL